MLLNELAQWAALLFIGVFVLGLTRQLGAFLVPPRARVEQNRGPDIGKRLPTTVLSREDRERLGTLMTERGTKWAALVVVGGDCPRCATLLENVTEGRVPDGAPVVALSTTTDLGYKVLLERVADLVVVDDELGDRSNLNVKPFVLIVDQALKVRHKHITSDLREAVAAWRGEPRTDLAQRTDGFPPIVKVGE